MTSVREVTFFCFIAGSTVIYNSKFTINKNAININRFVLQCLTPSWSQGLSSNELKLVKSHNDLKERLWYKKGGGGGKNGIIFK